MPRCADYMCGRWRPERLVPRWATGMRFNGEWYCSRSCVEHAAKVGLDEPALPAVTAGSLPPMRVGAFLRHLGAVSEKDLALALESQKTSGRRIGAELQHRGVIGAEPLLRALAAQGGVSYLTSFDVSRVANGPAWLPAETVRALGLVPFETNETKRSVRVVCSAPVPKASLRALAKLTGWTAEPYLVDDQVWRLALESYRPAAGQARYAGEALATGSMDAIAARIADTAFASRSATMRSGHVGRYTWVRVEGAQQVSDLLIPEQEVACQAERIAR
jgi:hypothetical protein